MWMERLRRQRKRIVCLSMTPLQKPVLIGTGRNRTIEICCASPAARNECCTTSEVGGVRRRRADATKPSAQLYTARVAAGDVPLRPGIETLLRAARDHGLKLAIATTTSRANVDALLTANLGPEALNWFAPMVCGDMVALKKPAPDVYEEALRILRLRPDETIAIEDSWNGVQAAHTAGIAVVATPSLYSANDDFSDADAVVTDSLCFDAILGLARRLRGSRAGAGLVHPDAGEARKVTEL